MASSATATAIPPPPSCSPSPSSPSTALIAAHPRKLGLVKFFNSTKGYGFIIPAEEEQQQLVATGQPPVEVFVHHTAITGGGFKSLAEGEEVEYDLIQGPKGMQAANVSGPGGKPVQGDPNAHRSYHHRYQSGGRHHYYHHHQQQQRQQQQQQQQQHHHHRSHQDSNGSGSDGSNGK
ncbi:cold-shock' DNA-binding domain-containing protein [Zychaea mexicana]|uniref:cold-shock' DNA-binding domain-containing protein n=1 Tax=Zychaea mexicana TaxID=64656 RepID=UPI0022FEEE3A|nr:cold-shock' DNA-binding domain-containing protein [Zychaea mexicana]KAI9490166.1 cold-shock' DNA-binding domain-containing protein [Zychaea mexicana]